MSNNQHTQRMELPETMWQLKPGRRTESGPSVKYLYQYAVIFVDIYPFTSQ